MRNSTILSSETDRFLVKPYSLKLYTIKCFKPTFFDRSVEKKVFKKIPLTWFTGLFLGKNIANLSRFDANSISIKNKTIMPLYVVSTCYGIAKNMQELRQVILPF